MARLQYVTVRETDLGAGIDQQSAENRIPQGYCEDIENADPKSTGQIAKRTGYQGYSGYVPVRVKEVDYQGTSITFVLDDSIELPNNQSSPIIVKGKTSTAVGDYAAETIIYYDGFTSDTRKTFPVGSNTVSLEQDEHDIDQKYMFVGLAESTNITNNNNNQFSPDSIDVDKTNFDIDTVVVNNTGSAFSGFIFAKDKAAESGVTYIAVGEAISTGSNTVSIPAATHNLDTTNIIVKVYEDTGSVLRSIVPEAVRLNDTTGDIEVDIENNTGAGFTADIILTAVSTANFATGAVANGATSTVIIDTSVTDGSSFAFIGAYLDPGTGTLEQVVPDSIVADDAAQTITVTFTNNSGAGANFELYWDFANIVNNRLTVTGTNAAAFNDTEPQLTIWGLCHEEIYGTRTAREGWVNHIDSYRAPLENRLISGLGGNLFSSQLRSETGNDTAFLMPQLYPNLNARLLADSVIGPAFYDTGETPGRTRGFITGDNGGTNFFTITSVAYNSGTGNVDYTLTVPSLTISGTLSTIISTAAGLEDQFTAQQCGIAAFNGVFTIKTVTNPTATTLVIGCENSSISSSDFDESDVGGLGAVFTDQLTFTATSPFLDNDNLDSDLFNDTDEFSAVSTSGAVTVIDNVVDIKSLPDGLRVVGQRTSSVVPMRDLGSTADVTNLVRGDMLTYTGINRQLRIKSINQLSDVSITITGDGASASVVLGSGDTTTLFIGKTVLVRGTSSYDGAQTITSIVNSTTFTFATALSTTEGGTMVGKTVEVDENLTFEDKTDSGNSFAVHSRWIPIEIPEDSFTETPKTRTTHFDADTYSGQEILRSTMVQDNLYVTNYDDEVLKFDGTNLYRAGLFRWQPNLFVTTDTTATGKIVMENPEATQTSNSTQNRFQVAESDRGVFSVGDQIQDSTDGEIYTIVEIIHDDPHAHINVNRVISGGTSGQTLTRIRTFSYYFRLNAVDANNNVIASAVAGSEDFVVRLGADAAVNLKLVGMPIWDIYDYDKLEVQIYRTQGDSAAPFYRLTTLAMSFNADDGYILYTDTDSDEDLRDLDEVNTALKGAELGTAWEQPMRAKYCTSAGNRLILGNLQDYPELDIQVLKNSGILTQSVFTNASNKDWQFRKDNTDTNTGTNMTDRALYEFVSATSVVAGITGTAGTSFSVNVVGHGLTAGDWVYLFHSAVADADQLTYSGWWHVNSITDVNNFVVRSANSGSGAAAAFPDRMAKASTSTNIPVFIGTDGNYSMVNGNRSSSEPYEFLAMRRLADAINASMRKVDTAVTGFDTFEPWMIANAGNEFNTGQVILRQPKIFGTTMEVALPNNNDSFDVFVNSIKRSASDQAQARTRLFPSRIIASYSNFPEIFDNPTASVDSESDSAIDINSADGQEITAIIPFFGDAAFGAAQKSGIVVVFKTNSIYLVDLAAKDAGQNAVQKLETRGKGCTAPYSVSVTKGGIMFANDTGIYRLNRNLSIDYIGRKYERKWKTTIEKGQIELFTGHHDTEANSYKLSYVTSSGTENSTVAVYNHTREYEGQGDGAWTTYTNHPATGWANLDADSFFATTDGRVYSIRKLGEDSDYRDDDQAIAMDILTRAMDQLESGKRKIFNKIISHYRNVGTSTGTTLEAALDLASVFQSTDSFTISDTTSNTTGLGDTGGQKIITIASVIDEKVGVYIQLRYQNSTLDEPFELAGFDIKVAAKSVHGILEAQETTDT